MSPRSRRLGNKAPSNMDPILTVLRFGGIERPIGGYGAMLALGILLGALLAARAASRAKMDVGAVVAAVGFCVGGALAGGSLLFVLVEWARTGDPMTGIRQPGLVFYGSPIGGFLGLWFGARQLEVPLGRLLDLTIPAIPLAHALGRIGCFLGGCCYGRAWGDPSLWAVRYTHEMAPGAHPSIWRHPTPLYEAFGLLILAFALAAWPLEKVGRGVRVGVYVLAYGVLRFGVEMFRGDAVRGVFFGGTLSTSQLIALGAVALGTAIVWRQRQVPQLA